MHTQTVFELSQEAERLLQFALHNLNALKQMPCGMQENHGAAGNGRSATIHPLHFSARGVAAQQETLQNELRKITHQEMVLAIVGTMKAGKSTTINAIVGTEVLPNRNRPMTALPTLIRHLPGQKEPVLHFSHVRPIDTLMQALQQRLANYPRDQLALQLEIDKDMESLLQRIASGTTFEKHYLGAQPIFHCLKSLNDLVRLSGALEVPFPFSAYAAIENIPVIEVEFMHLAGLEKGRGQLTLLDTPGPNEAGQPHLQSMLQEQISRASAVLAVMDYTQLKSISDEEVRQTLAAVSRSVPLFALVNKFDQKDRNSDDEEQVRALIAGTLMKGAIEPDHVFPVSSMWGDLANRARHELALRGSLPDHTEQRWVQDFAEAAMGRRWRTADLNDVDHVHHAANLLWEDSLFEQPIKALLHAAHANASLYALRSASHKLLNYAQSAEEYLGFRCQGLEIKSEQLQENITQLEGDIARLQHCQEGVRDEVQHEVKLALQTGAECIAGHEKQIQHAISAYFQTGKVPPVELSSTMSKAVSRRSDFEPGCRQIVLEEEGEARMMMHKLRASCEVILLSVQENLTRELELHFRHLENALARILRDALAPIEARVTDGLSQAGFRAHISLPAFQSSQLNFNAHQLFNEAIAEESVPVAQARRQASMRSTMARWLGSNEWGWEDYTMTSARYVIDLNKLHERLSHYVSHFCAQIRKAMNAQIDISVTAGLATFFADYQQGLASIEASLRQSLTARQQSEASLSQLRQQLNHCATTARFIHEDARLLRDDIQTLFQAEQ
ncbi:clamp-binding protein CrfC [Franconibacter helveticus 513]|uniref:clamp-binding protein CrfC n=2 Tax=Franconibacter helveticus TaxID=357240 RepID=UPI0003FE4230|nr:clamp-binding protein CrfC [Franconibacter helveticus]